MTRIHIPVVNNKENYAKLNQLVIIIIYQEKVIAYNLWRYSCRSADRRARRNVLVSN